MIREFFANRAAAKMARKEAARDEILAFTATATPKIRAMVQAELLTGTCAEDVARSIAKAQVMASTIRNAR